MSRTPLNVVSGKTFDVQRSFYISLFSCFYPSTNSIHSIESHQEKSGGQNLGSGGQNPEIISAVYSKMMRGKQNSNPTYPVC